MEVSSQQVHFIEAYQRKALARPVYPQKLLNLHPPKCEVYVTITIGENGRVVSVERKPRSLDLLNPYAETFFEAVKAAVSQWSFEPARNIYYQAEAGGEAKYLRAEIVEEQLDLKFTFEQSGTVR